MQKFRSEWLELPEFKDWLVECKLSGDGDMSQAQCKFCGTLLVNNSNNLVRHAISKKHMKNMELEKSDLNVTLGEQVPYVNLSMIILYFILRSEIDLKAHAPDNVRASVFQVCHQIVEVLSHPF